MNNLNLPKSILKAEFLVKAYDQGTNHLEVLKSVSLDIQEGDDICIVGSSGAGKSTLLHILGTLDKPDRGQVMFRGQNLFQMNDEELAKFRNQKMGFVFQFHHLMSEFSAIENVMLPCLIDGQGREVAQKRAEELLVQLNMGHRFNHYPNELSGGELQRVAIARALVNKPQILFADEPTGNLDSQNAWQTQELFFSLKHKYGLTLIVVTHDPIFAKRFRKVYKMKDGVFIP